MLHLSQVLKQDYTMQILKSLKPQMMEFSSSVDDLMPTPPSSSQDVYTNPTNGRVAALSLPNEPSKKRSTGMPFQDQASIPIRSSVLGLSQTASGSSSSKPAACKGFHQKGSSSISGAVSGSMIKRISISLPLVFLVSELVVFS